MNFALVVCIAFLVTLAHGLTDEQREHVKTVHKQCQADPATHADEEDLKKAYKDENIKGLGAHFLCMSRKMNIQKENGDVDETVLRREISHVITDEAKVDEAVKECGVKKGTPEDTAAFILKCFYDRVGHSLHEHHH